jgi:hypothetical protein
MKLGAKVLAAGIAALVLAAPAYAQQNQGQVRAQGQDQPLPPALQAAVQSGNPQVVQAAIATLAGNNPTRTADLANAVIAAAERLLTTNPQSAVSVASAAVQAVQSGPVQSASPVATSNVLTTASRIFVNPDANRVAPTLVGQLAANTVAAASNGANPTVTSAVASQAVSVAEKLLTTDPAAAVQLASSAVGAVNKAPIQQSQPQQALTVASTAARILVNPEVQRVAPQVVAQVANATVQIVSSPAVYAASPVAAIAVMSNSYTAVTSPLVIAAVPNAAEGVKQTLIQAASSGALNAANATNNKDITDILNKGADVVHDKIKDPIDTPIPFPKPIDHASPT